MTNNTFLHSPNKTRRLDFFNVIEPHMGMTLCNFSLTNILSHNRIEFGPLGAVGYNGNACSWSPNSNIFSLPVANPQNCIFVFNCSNMQFATILVKNPWIIKAHCYDYSSELELKDNQLPERAKHNKYPTKYYSKPENIIFYHSDLLWYDIENLSNLKYINQGKEITDLAPIDNGWNIFKGELPKSTEIIVWELRKFAEYGDPQSIEWINMIDRLKTKVNPWEKASHYIGYIAKSIF